MFPETSKPNLYKELFSALTPNKLLGFDAYLIIMKRRKAFFIEREVGKGGLLSGSQGL